MRRPATLLRLLTATLAIALTTGDALAQRRVIDDDRWLDRCREGEWGPADDHYCEVRDVPFSGSASRLVVDGGQNGGVTVLGWDQNRVQIRARIQTSGRSRTAASVIASDIRILTDGTIRAEGPDHTGRSNWSVSYVIYAPRKVDLDLRTNNGGIYLSNLEGSLRLRARNGGISLDGVSGDVRGETQNGGLQVTLGGDAWRGEGLDLETTNGGVSVEVPERYSATLETGTVNGGFDIDFPVTVQGRFSRHITAKLGDGGPRVRVTTTNGRVQLRRR